MSHIIKDLYDMYMSYLDEVLLVDNFVDCGVDISGRVATVADDLGFSLYVYVRMYSGALFQAFQSTMCSQIL